METNNPVFNSSKLVHAQYGDQAMSIGGTINKAIILFALMLMSAGASWIAFLNGYSSLFGVLQLGGLIGGLILAFMTIFKPVRAPKTAPLYAMCEGFAIGGFSIVLNAQYAGIITAAIGLTMSIFAAMLLIYKTGIIKVTDNLKIAIISAMTGILVFRLLMFVFGLFGVNVSIFNSGTLGLVMSLIIIGVASFNLMLDFDFINQGEGQGYAKFMEWYFAFGLLVSIVWLYVEILRMFSRRR